MHIRASLGIVTVVALVSTAAPRAEAADAGLPEARELYASAAYDDALTILNDLHSDEGSQDERRSIALYRTLCLVALGRTGEAERAIEAMVAHDPLYRVDPTNVPPRVHVVLTDARKRLLPGIIQKTYADSKAAYDRGDYDHALGGFTQTLAALDDPDVATAAAQSPLVDLRTLADGFRELSAKALAPVPPPAATPVVAVAAPQAPRLYDANYPNVVPPLVVKQAIPPFTGTVTMSSTGVLEVVINEQGSVDSARMLRALTPQYDKIVMSAARNWQYKPATLNGAPVTFVKRVQVVIVPNAR